MPFPSKVRDRMRQMRARRFWEARRKIRIRIGRRQRRVFAIGRQSRFWRLRYWGSRIGVRGRGKSKLSFKMILLESQGATLNKRMGDFDGRHNTALPVGTPQNGSKVLNRNNLRATRPNGEASLHLSCELIRNEIYVDCTLFVDLLLSSFFDQSLRVG